MALDTEIKNIWLEKNQALGGITLISHLFKRLDIIYNGRFTASYLNISELKEAEDVWSSYLAEDKITFEEVKFGLDQCRKRYKWPPSYAEFLDCCRPKLDYEACWHEAIRGLAERQKGKDIVWSNPAVYFAAIDFGYNAIMTSSYKTSQERWKNILDKRLGMDAESMPKPVQALVFKAPSDKERVKHHIQEIKSILSRARKVVID